MITSGDQTGDMATVGEIYDNWADLLEIWNDLEPTNEIAMYENLAKQFGDVIVELGIGYGRIARLVKPDYGVDLSRVMLEKCRQKMKTDCPQLILSDFKDYSLPEPATFTYLPQGTFENVLPEDRKTVFENVFRNTTPGGHFAFDSNVPKVDIMRRRSSMPLLYGRSETYTIYTIDVLRSTKTQTYLTHVYRETLDDQGRVTERRYYPSMTFHYIFPKQFKQLAQATGWEIVCAWGNFEGQPLTDSSYTQVWLLRKPEVAVKADDSKAMA